LGGIYRRGLYYRFVKRPLDVVLSLAALIILLPVIIVIAMLVRAYIGSPVLFGQRRPGLNEKIFTLYKFRTMSLECDDNGNLLPDTVRLSRFGRWLRATSLDELPELWNILKGEMSLVGPRPLAVEYLPHYFQQERVRHAVRPGLTGLAQVNGRNSLTWEKRFALDIRYVGDITFIADMKILFLTIIVAFRRRDVGERGVDSPPDFHLYRQCKTKEMSK